MRHRSAFQLQDRRRRRGGGVSCSSCDGYQLIAGADGILVRCPDCLVTVETVRCPVHGRAVVKGRCPSCGREASVATDLLKQATAAVARGVVAA